MNSRKGSILVPVLFGVIVSLVVTTGYFYLQAQNPTKQPDREIVEVTPSITQPVAKVSPTPTSVPVVQDETRDWKTYVDSQNRFSFKYPDNMVINKNGFTGGSGEIKTANFRYSNPPQGYKIEMQIYPDSNSLDGQVSLACVNAMTGEKFAGCIVSNITVNGSKTIVVTYADSKKTYFVYGKTIGIGFFEGPSTTETYKTVFDQILSTFKFL